MSGATARSPYFEYESTEREALLVTADGTFAYFAYDAVERQASVRGRPPLGPALADGLAGSPGAKVRLKTVLETIAGQRSVVDACALLGIREAAFHKLRRRALEAALESLEPRPPGRPPCQPDETDSHTAQLEQQVEDLKRHLQVAHVHEEMAITMPHLLAPGRSGLKKKRSARAARAKRGR
jgi:hypothetical protein